jgi:hypothetical protein
MPVIKMQLFSPAFDPFVTQRLPQQKHGLSIPVKASSLRSPMVSRIHNTPSGCSSCGKR